MPRLSPRAKALIYSNLEKYARSGMGMEKACESLLRQPRVSVNERRLYRGLLDGIQHGRSIGDALGGAGGFVTPLEHEVVVAAESGGKLEKGFAHLAEYFRRIDRTRKKILKGLAYPLFLIHLAIPVSTLAVTAFGSFRLDGETPKQEREAILKRLADGRLTVVSNAMVLTEGVDVPVVSCVVLARPTKSKGLYLQMAGRGLRTAPGKTDCLILDHGNCTMEHGLVRRDQNWQLTEDATRKRSKQVSYGETFKVCPDCGEVAELQADVCACGYRFAARAKQKPLKVYNGVLEEVTEQRVREYSEARRKATYFRLLYDQHTGTKKDGSPFSKGYAFVKYEAMFKMRPESGWREEWNDANARLINQYAMAWDRWNAQFEPQSCTCHMGHPPCGWCTSPNRTEQDFAHV